MNIKELKARMILFGDTGKTLSSAIGISRNTLSAKMSENNKADFTREEIKKIKERYNLSPTEVDNIFFAQLVSQKDTK